MHFTASANLLSQCEKKIDNIRGRAVHVTEQSTTILLCSFFCFYTFPIVGGTHFANAAVSFSPEKNICQSLDADDSGFR